mgnify:CR=1 FL=1
MKKILQKILPNKLFIIYRFLKKQLRFVPKDEQIYFDTNTVYSGHFNVTYRGIQAIRCPFDYVIYQMIIWETKPDLIIEIGTSNGGGALYMADILDQIGNGIIHTINIEDKADKEVREHPRIKLFTNGWENYNIELTKNFSKILIIDDGSHTYEDAIGSLKKFSHLISLNSYFIVEDGIVNELGKGKGFHGGPLKAINEFLKSNSNFKVDRDYCDMFGKNATFNVNGYLKRVK